MAVHASLARACTGVTTLTAELGLSGRAGTQRLRGRVIAGFAAPDRMRLEGVAPFGAPGFILVARGSTATLLLPREHGVLRGATAEEILGAMTGVALSTSELLAVLDGCVVPAPMPESAMMHANGMVSIRLRGTVTEYLQRQGAAWQMRAAHRPGWDIEYPSWSGGFPSAMRLRSPSGAATAVDLSASISQLDTNATIPADAFDVKVPNDARPITLEDLRDAGPLRGNP